MAKTLLNKMSSKSIIGNIKQLLRDIKENGEKKDLFKLWGTVSGMETGEHETNGPWVKFIGEFNAINLVTGKEFESFDCFLPETMTKLLTNAKNNANAVEFAVNVAMVRDDGLAVGYQYEVTPLIEAKESDRMAKLRAVAIGYSPAIAPQLGAPVAEEPTPEIDGEVEVKATPAKSKAK